MCSVAVVNSHIVLSCSTQLSAFCCVVLQLTHELEHVAKTYSVVVWVMVGLGALILGLGINQPFVLIAIAAILNGLVMVVCCVLIIRVNTALDRRVRISPARRVALGVAGVVYTGFTIYTIVSWI